MIIGISGRIGSGKDTVGKIIQYLIDKYTDGTQAFGDTGNDFNMYLKDVCEEDKLWQIKKFAGKLKQIVSILTGIPAQDLEVPVVKDTVLSNNWQVFELYNHDKRVAHGGMNRVITSFATEEEARDFCDEKTNSQHQFTYKKTECTVRWLLQTLGTNALRDVIQCAC